MIAALLNISNTEKRGYCVSFNIRVNVCQVHHTLYHSMAHFALGVTQNKRNKIS